MKKVDAQMNFPKLEAEVLEYWKQENIFGETLKKDAPKGEFVFFEGPPTANGKPGLHHILARSFKDIIPRYKTMRGYRVNRKAGWDTHGLPVELQVEKALGLRNKQDIENIVPGDVRTSVIEFNKKCKESVWEYKDLWEKMTERMGYWVDMEHPYITYDNSYIESVWWQLKQIAELENDKGESFLYQGHKVVPYCYRCGTALSSHEVSQGYETVKDNSVYVKFTIDEGQNFFGGTVRPNTHFLVWTTTPWTLPGNVALAINRGISYVQLEHRDGNIYVVANSEKDRLFNFEDIIRINGVYDGSYLLDENEELFYAKPFSSDKGILVGGAFVAEGSGTGIVHIAPAFGEDDANVGRENNLPTLITVDEAGKMAEGFPGAGMPVKKKNDKNRYAVDDLIIEDLMSRGLLFKEEVYEHEYPFCWRSDTPLIYYVKPSWFIRMSELRDELVAGNQDIQWVPENIREGRFGEWLRGAKDWAISRERYWGTPLPIWHCDSCDHQVVVGTQTELTSLSGIELEDLHKPYIDDIAWRCSCGGQMIRTPEVLDVWFDSGAMPLAQNSYIGKGNVPHFPADYISEAVDQTRGWFYTLHAIATLLKKRGIVFEGKAYRSVVCLGHVLDAKGKKMSKSKGNVTDPFEAFETYGADALRWFFYSVNQPGLPKRFDPKGMREVQGRVFRMLWNSYSFFTTYAALDGFAPALQTESPKKVMDRWILADLQELKDFVTEDLDNLEVLKATEKLELFIDYLSNWYIRLNRDRFWKNENDGDKKEAYRTLYTVLVELAQLLAPFIPFVTEEIYRNLTGEKSVHLSLWPQKNGNLCDVSLIEDMQKLRHIVSVGLQKRSVQGVKVRQPLGTIFLPQDFSSVFNRGLEEESVDWQMIILKELNVKRVALGDYSEIDLDWDITPDLKLEGEMREIIRALQEGRKKAGFNVEDRIVLGYSGKEEVLAAHQDEIAREILAMGVQQGEIVDADYTNTVNIEGVRFTFWLKKSI